MLTVGSLFSGIGGLDLGLERAGMRVIWNCEIDPYAVRVLKKHWPDVPNIGNIKEVNWNAIPRPDVLCGGYPCQPFSQAGQRKGEEDPRHLFPWVAEAIRQLRPRYAIMENVSGHLSMGFGTVQGLLAEIGYDSRWDCVPAAAVGAPHLRDRVFIIATPRPEQRRPMANSDDTGSRDPLRTGWDAPWNGCPTVSYANLDGQHGFPKREEEMAVAVSDPSCVGWIGRGKQGTEESENYERKWHRGSPNWSPEPSVGRVAHGIPNRMDRLRGLGNAVVPQVAEHIGRIVMAHARES